MKTPRELLFHRHDAAGAKLDALRHAVIARQCAPAERGCSQKSGNDAIYPTPSRPFWLARFLVRLWRELVHPCRHVWTGLATVWLVLILVNLTQRDRASTGVAPSASLAQVVIPIYTQEKLVNEMFAERGQRLEAVRPPKFEPKPRSETSGVLIL